MELIRNVHPAANEQVTYVPTARGGATGDSFALVAFVANPDQSGQILLLAGLNREGTQAAGNLVTDPARLAAALRTCGISPAGPLKHFQILLHVYTMAGSPSQFDVYACHVLAGEDRHPCYRFFPRFASNRFRLLARSLSARRVKRVERHELNPSHQPGVSRFRGNRYS